MIKPVNLMTENEIVATLANHLSKKGHIIQKSTDGKVDCL